MFKTFRLITLLPLLTLLLSFASSACVNAVEAANANDSFEFTGTIVYVPTEGGFYGIEADAKKNAAAEKYLPTHLKEDFRKEGLRVKVQAQLVTEQKSFKMWGKMIDIILIMPTNGEAKDQDQHE